jgi:HAD superfamily hydrolase (TIGR01549 family)
VKIKAIVFDLDSTLIETSVDFPKMKRNMINELEKNGYPRDKLSPTNQTTVQILEEVEKYWDKTEKPEEEREKILEKMDFFMNQGELESIKNLKEIPGAAWAIKKLKEMGYKLAILTRGHNEYAVEALEKVGVKDHFDLILGRGETPKPKPYPEALLYTAERLGVDISETVMVGDHQIDSDSASSSGCDFIGVATGRRGLRSWTNEMPPPVLLDSVKELPEYLKTLQRV